MADRMQFLVRFGERWKVKTLDIDTANLDRYEFICPCHLIEETMTEDDMIDEEVTHWSSTILEG